MLLIHRNCDLRKSIESDCMEDDCCSRKLACLTEKCDQSDNQLDEWMLDTVVQTHAILRLKVRPTSGVNDRSIEQSILSHEYYDAVINFSFSLITDCQVRYELVQLIIVIVDFDFSCIPTSIPIFLRPPISF